MNTKEKNELLDLIQEMAVDFAWENSIDIRKGYQEVIRKYNHWLSNSVYHSKKLASMLNSEQGVQASVASKAENRTKS